MLAIIDYGMGNLRSILHKIEKLKVRVCIASSAEEIAKADKVILPGVGNFSEAMKNLYDLGLVELLTKKVMEDGTPILGICLGMQLFTEKSEEGYTTGLGWIEGETRRFNFVGYNQKLRIPHVGWNNVKTMKVNSLLKGIPEGTRFYFTHSYHLITSDENVVIGKSEYGYEFVSVIQKDNIYGTQFHPEKSHKVGMKVIENFVFRS